MQPGRAGWSGAPGHWARPSQAAQQHEPQDSTSSSSFRSAASSSSNASASAGQPDKLASGASSSASAYGPGELQSSAGPSSLASIYQPILGTADQPASGHEQEGENRKLRLQLYVFVLRCISYSFNAKPTNTSCVHYKQQQMKLRKSQLEQVKQLHTHFCQSAGSFAPDRMPHSQMRLAAQQMRQLNELYERAHLRFNAKYLHSEKMRLLVESECCSQQDLRELFRQCVERTLEASPVFEAAPRGARGRFGSSPASSGVPLEQPAAANKELVINAWLIKFESILREEPAEGAPSDSALAAIQQQLNNVHLQQDLERELQQSTSREHLYQMFQNILNIKKFEHQLLYNALQLDSADEQAAAVRRELDGRISRIAELERNKKLLPKFVLKEMESLYLEEARMAVNKLMVNLDSLPVSRSAASGAAETPKSVYGGLHKFRRYNNSLPRVLVDHERLKRKHPVASFILSNAQKPLWSFTYSGFSKIGKLAAQASLARDGLTESHPSEPSLSKLDVVLTFNIEVVVMEVRGLRQLAARREIYCTMEIEGSEKLQTEHVQAKSPHWDTQGDFTTNHPLPVLKIKLYAVNQSVLSLEDKELGRLVLRPTVLSAKTPEWCAMQPSAASGERANSAAGSSSQDSGRAPDAEDQELRIRVAVRMDRPQQLKHCGYLYGMGKSTWHKLKRRYHTLIQVSQYTFVMCSYRDKKAKPAEMLHLEGYTVDYIEPPTELIMEHCAEITASASEHHGQHGHHGPQSGGHASSTFGLAGRLASALLKQQASSSSGALDQSDTLMQSALQHQMELGEQASPMQTAAALSDELHSKFYFNVVKEGDSVVFACDDEQDCFGWVMALYRATGQAHKPTPLRNQYGQSGAGGTHYVDAAFAYQTSANQSTKLVGNASLSGASSGIGAANGGPRSSVDAADQRARKHGMDEFIGADPCKFQHQQLFKYLQHETLRYRLNDAYCSLGWLSTGQVFVLDEYCARYGVRTCFRHLAYLDSLLEFQGQSFFIDHTLLNYAYDFSVSHVTGNSAQSNPLGSVNLDARPGGIGTVTVEERDLFHAIKTKLLKMIERQISNFATSFPFGKPDGALKATLSLLERVLLKEHQCNSMVQNDEVRALIRKCLEQAAFNSYTNMSGHTNLLAPPASLVAGGPCEAARQAGQAEPAVAAAPTPTPELSGPARAASSLSSASTGPGSLASASGASSASGPPPAGSKDDKCLTMAMIINNERVRARDKLRYLTRLAELCCELVEENDEYFSDAFAWHSDLMLEHYEIFWSLFSVDMDKILAELAASGAPLASSASASASASSPSPPVLSSSQLPGSPSGASMLAAGQFIAHTKFMAGMGAAPASARDPLPGQLSSAELLAQAGPSQRESFALFQVLNNHMRKSPNLECKRFKAHLCDTFKPRLLRYIDVMEASLTGALAKAHEREGQVNGQLVEQTFQRLRELQRFVLSQLRWPDEQLAEQLHQRLKLIAYEICDASVQRALQAFQVSERKANKWTASATAASFAAPTDTVQMINIVLETRSHSLHLCTFNNFDQMSYHSKIDRLVESALAEMQPGLMSKMLSALESTLGKLARYDEGNLLAPILSLTYKQGMSASGRDIGKQYVSFVSNCCDLLRHKINDELWIVNVLEEWFAAQTNIICTWLGERIDRPLHDVQLVALSSILPKLYADMSLQGVPDDKLNLKSYQTIMSRLRMEEESAAVGAPATPDAPSQGGLFGQTSSILSSLTASSSSPPAAGAQTPLAGAQQQQPAQTTPPLANARSLPRHSDSPTSGAQQHPQRGSSGGAGEPPADNNIADRALQSASRMFKGFWAS